MDKKGRRPALFLIASVMVFAAGSVRATDLKSVQPSDPGTADVAITGITTGGRDPGINISPVIRGESPVRRIEVFVVESGEPDSVTVGFHVELEHDWHLYWTNPGDAGLAPAVNWTLPDGFTAGPLRHPVPRKTVEDGLVSYTHPSEVLLLCEIVPGPNHRPEEPWEAAAVFEWMACHESCVTGETAVGFAFPPSPEEAARGKAIYEKFASRFPKPLSEAGLVAGQGRAEWTGEAWLVEIPLTGDGAAGAEDFLVAPQENFVIDNAAARCRDGKIVVPLHPSGGPGSPPPAVVGGIVILDGIGYEISVPVETIRQVLDPETAASSHLWTPSRLVEQNGSIPHSFPITIDIVAAPAASGTHSI